MSRLTVESISNTAEDFLAAYIALEVRNTVVFPHTRGDDGHFHADEETWNRIRSGELYQTSSANVTCLAFALELYLKALNLKTTGNPQRGHDLKALFDQLPPDVRDELRARMRELRRPFVDDFDSTLAEAAHAFERWRYVHEVGFASFPISFARTLAVAIAEQIGRQVLREDAFTRTMALKPRA